MKTSLIFRQYSKFIVRIKSTEVNESILVKPGYAPDIAVEIVNKYGRDARMNIFIDTGEDHPLVSTKTRLPLLTKPTGDKKATVRSIQYIYDPDKGVLIQKMVGSPDREIKLEGNS